MYTLCNVSPRSGFPGGMHLDSFLEIGQCLFVADPSFALAHVVYGDCTLGILRHYEILFGWHHLVWGGWDGTMVAVLLFHYCNSGRFAFVLLNDGQLEIVDPYLIRS